MSKHTAAKKVAQPSKAPRVADELDNPFADLGFANPELELAKSRLVMEMARVIEARDLSQARAGEIIGLPQPKLSRLVNGHWKSYSVDRLTRYLNKLGVTVRITLERNRENWQEGQFVVAESSTVIHCWQKLQSDRALLSENDFADVSLRPVTIVRECAKRQGTPLATFLHVSRENDGKWDSVSDESLPADAPVRNWASQVDAKFVTLRLESILVSTTLRAVSTLEAAPDLRSLERALCKVLTEQNLLDRGTVFDLVLDNQRRIFATGLRYSRAIEEWPIRNRAWLAGIHQLKLVFGVRPAAAKASC